MIIVSMLAALFVLLAACGGDDAAEDIATEPEPTATEVPADEPTPEPEPTVAATDDDVADDAPTEPDPTPTAQPEEPTPEPAPAVDLAPELAGLTDWRNGDPVSLEDLRGEPVVLVFWNSI